MRYFMLVVCLFAPMPVFGQDGTPYREAAAKFVEQLTPELQAKLAFDFSDDEREAWHYTPLDRAGLAFTDLNDVQRTALLDLLHAVLGDEGFQKTENIRELEDILWKMRGQTDGVKMSDLYYLSVFGVPGVETPWGLRYEGHHLSLNWTFVNGQVVSSTPQFLGANPAEVPSGPRQGWRVLALDEDLARKLLDSLDEAQRGKAITTDVAPAEIMTREDRVAAIQEHVGITYPELTETQQGILLDLISAVAQVQRPDIFRARMDRVRSGGLDKIEFAWMGGIEKGQGHYYRIQGPAFLIEYDNTQNNANHIHTVWRDFDGDFGRDTLKEHYDNAPDEHGHDGN
ncbi:MAG: DUF3500 domain-containing protein [Candidatus Hydrogenedentes bacterium]|nr:DUF3500 domain-containing protein [Candidatus Hydrogenedentota bacterium]